MTISRRAALAASAAGVAAVALAACTSGPTTPGEPGEVVARRSDVGDGALVTQTKNKSDIVIVADGADVHAFTAVCPHAGCIVREEAGALDCPCHGSRFNLASGDVEKGPATRGLAPIAVRVVGEDIVLA